MQSRQVHQDQKCDDGPQMQVKMEDKKWKWICKYIQLCKSIQKNADSVSQPILPLDLKRLQA